MLTQGVTTEILNPDGGGSPDLQQQLAQASAAGLAVNIGTYIGFNAVWSDVMGPADRRATPEEIDRMRTLVTSGLEHGAWGVSAGLDYKPAYYAQVEEVVRVVEAAAPWRTNFPNHDRLTPESNFSSRVGVAETIAIAEKAGLVPVVTHMKSQGREQGGAAKLLAMMNQATKRGAYTAADAYPYLAGQTSLGALLVPAWAQDGGRDAMLERFKDPQLRARIVRETEQAMNARFGGPSGVYLPRTGQELVDIMREQQVSAGEAVIRILEEGNTTAILRFGAESDLVKILRHPTTSIACDCGATTDTRQHPRAFGTFPRVLGRYVREQKVLTWEDAIRKMTALPANTIGIVDRGYLAPGMAADIAVFDPDAVVDHATYQDPGKLSEGIKYVLVNGRIALADGKPTGAQGGHMLLRSSAMPSRPMSNRIRRSLMASATLGEFDLAVDVTQSPDARRPKGQVRITDRASQRVLDAVDVDLGMLQTAKDWAGLTLRGRMRPALSGVEGLGTSGVQGFTLSGAEGPDTVERSITILVDRSRTPGRAGTATIHIDGAVVASGPLDGGVSITMR
jgi:N-acyl-D-aspartate/D-glutamate deacylase